MVFLPLKDDNPLKFIWFQFTTVTLILINVVVFIWQDSLGEKGLVTVAMLGGVTPTNLLGSAKVPPELLRLPPEATLITYMFLHGDWWHLIGNMLFLWVFGDNVEDALGHQRFLVFYLLSGIAGGLAHAWALPHSTLPLIGASGAVAGVIAAYLILHPRVRVWVLAFRIIPLRIRAAWVLGVWVVTQLVMIAIAPFDQVAWFAHVGGMAAGAILVLVLRRPGVPLFDKGLEPADQRAS